jgi:ABC-type branched-subunit amino acid transport system ATPase component
MIVTATCVLDGDSRTRSSGPSSRQRSAGSPSATARGTPPGSVAEVRNRASARCGAIRSFERVDALLNLVGISDVADRAVSGLSLGTSRLVEVARALATKPSVLLLDEPLSGLSGHDSEVLGEILCTVAHEQDIAVLLVEHDVPMVLKLCSMISVLDFGEVIATGTPEQIRADRAVQTAYLGDTVVAGASEGDG